MADEKKREELSRLRLEYAAKRELLLQNKVDHLGLRLFDMVFEKHLKNLEQSNGKILKNNRNISAVRALDQIYKTFNTQYNIPVAKSFFNDMPGIATLNEKYFNEVVDNKKTVEVSKYRAETIVNKQLGVTRDGKLVSGGFADKFVSSREVLDKIKKKTLQAITQGKGFQEFRNELKQTIQGYPGKGPTGSLHQYYRNNAYDTYSKVDRLYSDLMAKDLKLKYFYWSGGVIPTTRALCRKCNGKIFNAADVKKLTYSNLKPDLRDGVPDGKHSVWNPLHDLGGYGCRHHKDYISTQVAIKRLRDVFNVNALLIKEIKLDVIPLTSKQLMKKGKEAGTQLERLQKELSEKNKAFSTPVNYKSEASIERKVTNDYNGDYSKVKDAVRTTVIADRDKIDQVISDLKDKPEFLKIKSQDHNKDPLGYSGNLAHVQAENGLVMEVQVNTARMIYAKEEFAKSILGEKLFNQIKNETGLEHGLGHKYYEEWRVLNPKQHAEKMIEIEKKSREYYSNFLD